MEVSWQVQAPVPGNTEENMPRVLTSARPVHYVSDVNTQVAQRISNGQALICRAEWGAILLEEGHPIRIHHGQTLDPLSGDHLLPEIAKLLWSAEAVATNAYAPYSHFPVGAAVLTEDGGIFLGCNVENGSYGLTLCAERNALAAAIAAGHRDIRHIALFTATAHPQTPCGACRQVIAELAPNAEIWASGLGAEVRVYTSAELLPVPFQVS